MGRTADSRLRNGGEGEPARKKDQGGAADWRGFVNIELNNSQKAQFDDWVATGESWEVVDGAVAAGCNLSLKSDGRGSGFLDRNG